MLATCARYPALPPCLRRSRDTTDGCRPTRAAISRFDNLSARPREISSRSTPVNIRRTPATQDSHDDHTNTETVLSRQTHQIASTPREKEALRLRSCDGGSQDLIRNKYPTDRPRNMTHQPLESRAIYRRLYRGVKCQSPVSRQARSRAPHTEGKHADH